jgi:hypothetical protein
MQMAQETLLEEGADERTARRARGTVQNQDRWLRQDTSQRSEALIMVWLKTLRLSPGSP